MPLAGAARLSSLLAAMQLADGALPIGRYAHAGGLEDILRHGGPVDAGTLDELVDAALLHGAGPLDGVAVAHAHDATLADDPDALRALDTRLLARRMTEASRQASTGCGRQLAALAPRLADHPVLARLCAAVRAGEAPGNLAVVAGSLAAAMGLGRDEAVLIELRGAATMMLSAAVRLGAVSAGAAQALLRAREPAILVAVARALAATPGEMGATSFELEIATMRQRHSDARLFAT